MGITPRLMYDVERINRDIPIESVISYYTTTEVKTRGNMCCPSVYHEDKHPSAHIYRKTNTCMCFSCQRNFTPLDIAVEAMPSEKFPVVCQRLLEDMGYDPYEYSNLKEVEQAKMLKKDSKESVSEYQDYFPFNARELREMGLYDHTTLSDRDAKVAVIIPLNQIQTVIDVYNARKLLGENKTFSKAQNEPLTILTMDLDAVDILNLQPYEFYSSSKESLIQLWRKDKTTIERLIENFCRATISTQQMLLKSTTELLKSEMASFNADEADKITQQYIERLCRANTDKERNAIMASITPKEREMWYTQRYIGDLHSKIREIEDKIQTVQSLYQRLTEHQKERAKHTKPKSWRDFCTSR